MSLAEASEMKSNGKRPRDETDQPECQSPTKETRTEPKTEEPKNKDTEDGFFDCQGRVVIMCSNEEPDSYRWFAVPEFNFSEDLKPVAERFGYKGDSMIQYLRQARCIGEEEVPLDEQKEGDAITDVLAKWYAAGFACHAEVNQDGTSRNVRYRFGGRMAQLKNVAYFVSIDIFQ